MMIDPWPRGKKYAEYTRSGQREKIAVPSSSELAPLVGAISEAAAEKSVDAARKACADLLGSFSDFYGVRAPLVRVFPGPRPHSTFEGRLAAQLFGDYHTGRATIRLWIRTAMKKEWTSPKSILATLCHEFMHHLDVSHLGFPNTFHTIGFFERTHRLYLAAIGSPYYELAWSMAVSVDKRGRARPSRVLIDINWAETNRRRAKALARIKRKLGSAD
jgi:hypothetical protein